MKTFAIGLAAAALFSGAALAQDLSGRWFGGYFSQDGADNNSFEFTIGSGGAAFTGQGFETNLIGDSARVLFLTSTIQGRVERDGTVRFEKTYDGSGGVSHSVQYVGRLDATGRRIQGTYDAGGSTGRFEMVR